MVASPSGISFGNRLMVGFGGFSPEPPLLLLVLKGFWTWGLSLSPEKPAIWMHLYSHLLPLVVLGIFSSSMTLLHVINLLHHYLALSAVDTTYDLGVLSPGLGITVACQHSLILAAFCGHTGCWVGSSGSSLAWASCPTYSCPLEGLLHCCKGSGDCLVGCFKSFASNH